MSIYGQIARFVSPQFIFDGKSLTNRVRTVAIQLTRLGFLIIFESQFHLDDLRDVTLLFVTERHDSIRRNYFWFLWVDDLAFQTHFICSVVTRRILQVMIGAKRGWLESFLAFRTFHRGYQLHLTGRNTHSKLRMSLLLPWLLKIGDLNDLVLFLDLIDLLLICLLSWSHSWWKSKRDRFCWAFLVEISTSVDTFKFEGASWGSHISS